MKRAIVPALILLLSACDGGGGSHDAGTDASQSSMDAGTDGGPPWTSPDCNPEIGIECDGDWADRCTPACSASQCCAPQDGRFSCVDRAADGACPAANIWVDADRIVDHTNGEKNYWVQWRHFEETDCAIVEGCVTQPGWRRLLHFGTWTPNTGDADLFLGRPADGPPFQYSECHGHYHFNGYANYELRGDGDAVVAEGHKQAFCLLDFYHYPGTDDTGWHYTCDNQGIQRGWQDVYDDTLDCQWVDVTDVAAGDYTLHIALNVDHALLESNYDDNTADVTVTIPVDEPIDVTAACTGERNGEFRDCGWATDETTYTCTAGETVTVGCSAACNLGTCTGDTVLRVCDPNMFRMTHDCDGQAVLATDDESGCSDTDHCSSASFTCPGSGQFVVYTAAYYSDETASCTFAIDPPPATTP